MTALAERATTRRPVTTRADVLERLRAAEAEIRSKGVTGLYLFGSAARDELTDASDIDVFVDYDEASIGSFGYVQWLDLSDDLLPELLGRKMDFTSRRGLHPRMKESIMRSAIRVF